MTANFRVRAGFYGIAREHYGLQASLINLTPKRLLILAVAFSFANPLLTNLWLALCGNTTNLYERFFAMFVGDLSGALSVLYAMRGLLGLLAMRSKTSRV